MPVFDYQCEECGEVFESIEIWGSHIPTECKKCKSSKIHKIFSRGFHVRPDAEVMKHNLPDPVPPLEELRDKAIPGSETSLKDKPEASTNLGNYTRRKDKYGNTLWIEKKKVYHDMGRK